jgi:hypothetical protein
MGYELNISAVNQLGPPMRPPARRLNPWVGKGADFVRANATICLKNGSPIPQGLVKTSPEPSELGQIQGLLRANSLL